MKFLKLLFFIFISFVISCSSINVKSTLGNEQNVFIVKKIIDNYMNLETYLNDTTLCYQYLLNDGLNSYIYSLKEHIIKNKFYEGYGFEISDSIKKGYFLPQYFNGEKQLFDTNNYVLSNFIKIRSNFNKDIIWFIFDYNKGQKKWILSQIEYCNNYNQQAWGEDVPCDKK